MVKDEGIHAGHRKRLIERFVKNPEGFLPHEYLELLLFFSIPRKNTNDLAHNLLQTFGTMEKVFSASVEELQVVDGVGERTATFLSLFGQIQKATFNLKEQKERMNNFSSAKATIEKYFEGLTEENFYLFLLDKKHNVITKIRFSDEKISSVGVEVNRIANAFSLNKAVFVIIAHNHPSGNCQPSKQDDFTTQHINLICNLQGVVLADHLIYTKNETYSYFDSGRLTKIKQITELKKIFQYEGV